MPPPLPTPPEPRSDTLRLRWLWCAVPLLLVVAGLAFWSRDEPPHDVSDLVYEPLALADGDNAYVQLTQAAELARQLLPADEAALLENPDGTESWDAGTVAGVLSRLDPVWPRYERATRLEYAQGPVPDSVDALIPEVGHLMSLARCWHARALFRLESGDPDGALHLSLTLLRSGRLLQDSRSTIVTCLTGVAQQSLACEIMQKASRHPDVSPLALQTAVASLEDNRSGSGALGYAFRSELPFVRSALDVVMQENRKVRRLSLFPLLYKPNKTERLYADELRRVLGLLDADVAAVTASRQRSRAAQTEIRLYNPENIIGRILLQIITPTFESLIENRLKHQSRISATQALLAVRIHEKRHGDLPASLHTLTPGILPAVPRDYFDHGDIKYSREAGYIWAVGAGSLVITEPRQSIDEREIALRIAP